MSIDTRKYYWPVGVDSQHITNKNISGERSTTRGLRAAYDANATNVAYTSAPFEPSLPSVIDSPGVYPPLRSPSCAHPSPPLPGLKRFTCWIVGPNLHNCVPCNLKMLHMFTVQLQNRYFDRRVIQTYLFVCCVIQQALTLVCRVTLNS